MKVQYTLTLQEAEQTIKEHFIECSAFGSDIKVAITPTTQDFFDASDIYKNWERNLIALIKLVRSAVSDNATSNGRLTTSLADCKKFVEVYFTRLAGSNVGE